VSQLFLYEPRMLVRSAIQAFTHDMVSIPSHVYPLLTPLVENICSSIPHDSVVLAGVGGAGIHLAELFKLLRSLKICRVKTIVWVPAGYPNVALLLRGLGVHHLLMEENLDTDLVGAIKMDKQPDASLTRCDNPLGNQRLISQTELDILLQFVSGLSTKEIAHRRGCSYKTVFTWKHNLCASLKLQNGEHWLSMLTEIHQMSALYQAR